MHRLVLGAVIALVGCGRPGGGPPPKAGAPVPKDGERAVTDKGPKMIRVVLHRKAFNFTGVDRVSILGSELKNVKSPIPFHESDIEESAIPFDPSRFPDGKPPDFIHRFKRPDGYFVDFHINDGRIDIVVESTRPYMNPP